MANFYKYYQILLFLLINVSTLAAESNDQNQRINNVLSFGAKANGLTDSTKPFLQAWAAACRSGEAAVVSVPKGRYLVRPMVFEGPCKSPRVTIRIDGILVGPLDYRVLGAADAWLDFNKVDGVSIIGGTLDAGGPALWACKASGSTKCPAGATSLSFTNSENIKIRGLVSLNSQMFHIVINRCTNVEMKDVKIIARASSPNTDGIHVQLSKNVKILDSDIKTGDDCVSIGPGTYNLWIEGIACGPGHGISIGSLAKDLEEEGVQNVTVKKSIFRGSDNGLRIKSWARPSKGFVRTVQFIDAIMQNVKYPILIDQNYCPRQINCPGQVSGIKISDIKYEDIRGSSATQIGVKLECSANNPCTGIQFNGVKLTYQNKYALFSCVNANGKAFGCDLL